MIIDAHVHLSAYQDSCETLSDALEKLLGEMQNNGISHAVVIPDNRENDPKIADLLHARELLKGHENLFLLGSPQIIQRGSDEIKYYRSLLSSQTIHGIKLFPGHDPYNLSDERCQPYCELLQEFDYPLLVHTGDLSSDPNIHNPLEYNDPKYIVDVAQRYPGLMVIITHYYWPRLDYCYEITKDVPNIYFEIAGLADNVVLSASGGLDKMREVLLETITDRPDQVMYGTDWPMCDWGGKSGFAHHIELINSLDLPQDVQDMIFFGTANRIYQLGLSLI